MLKPSQVIAPTPEIILEAKQSYNRILKRCNEASKYFDNPGVSPEEKDKRVLAFRIEIVDTLEAYLRVLEDWKVEVSPEEIIKGFNL